ncbi:MAG: hypothetical protein KIS66_01910 [Fimbriimonadaceae bacterium]|nr:hypothetical protein [Fimbriimonadaceae bacterium]
MRDPLSAPLVQFETIGDAWTKVKEDLNVWVPAAFIGLFLAGVPNGFDLRFDGKGDTPWTGIPGPIGITGILALVGVGLWLKVLSMVIGTLVSAGLTRLALMKLSGRAIRLTDMLAVTHRIVPLLIVAVITTVATTMGTLACCFPGLVLTALFSLAVPRIVAGQTDPFKAIMESVNALKSEWLAMSLFILALGFLQVVGAFCCLVGLLFTYPVIWMATAMIYLRAFGGELRMD